MENEENPSISVFESILNSRIDQMSAITLPSDQHRKDVLIAIKEINPSSKRLSSFCDYLIDYIGSLTMKLEKSKNKINKLKQEVVKINRNDMNDSFSMRSNQSERIEEDINKIKNKIGKTKNVQYGNNNNDQGDYQKCLKLMKAKDGQLYAFINDILEQNMRLQRLHNQDRAILLKQHFVIQQDDFQEEDDDFESYNNFKRKKTEFKDSSSYSSMSISKNESSDESDSISDKKKRKNTKKRPNINYSNTNTDDLIIHECKQLKSDFQKISEDIESLNQEIQKRHRKKKYHH